MKKRWMMIVLVLCLTMSLLACGKKTGDESEALQTQAQMTWQEQYDLGIRLLNEGKTRMPSWHSRLPSRSILRRRMPM